MFRASNLLSIVFSGLSKWFQYNNYFYFVFPLFHNRKATIEEQFAYFHYFPIQHCILTKGGFMLAITHAIDSIVKEILYYYAHDSIYAILPSLYYLCS